MRALPKLSIIAAALLLTACGPKEPDSAGAPPDMRRLTEEQYRNTILDIFGPTITYGGRFDPLGRVDGLIQLDARTARVTPAGFEQYYALARSIASQAVTPPNRAALVSCQPAAADAPDDACAQTFLTEVGRLLYRRPLTPSELSLSVKAAHDAAAERGDFYEGLAYSLSGLMMTPKFLFVIDMTEPDPAHPGRQRLTAFARASRLSYLLWNSTPDTMLLDAAAQGDLDTARGLAAQAERMMASPKFENGVRAFFTDFLDLQKFDTLEKDQVIYPTFNVKANEDAKEGLLRTVVDHVAVQDRDYRDLFTTRRAFVSPPLARIYRIPAGRPDGGWSQYEFAKDDPRAGILTQIAFLAVNAHPGRSSPTIRGRAIRETVLCQKVPDPPGDVDFSKFNDVNSPDKTAKARLTAHRTAPACAGCHKITDPIGLGLENFDGAGALRSTENGAPIDASGDLDGKPFKDAAGLARQVRDNPATSSCLVNRLYAYALGRAPRGDEKQVVDYFQASFAGDGYSVRKLLRRIAVSNAFYEVRPSTAATQALPTEESKS
jgi:hypothetical protein